MPDPSDTSAASDSSPAPPSDSADGDVARFWDAQASSVDPDSDLSSFGTVTAQSAIAAYRDRLERAHLARLLELSSESRVLDLGGGAGRIALWLAPRVAHVTLVDLSQGLLDVAQRRARAAGITNLTTRRGFAVDAMGDGPYDAILLIGVCMYLEEPDLERLATLVPRLLAPGGKLYLKDPVSTDGQARLDEAHDSGLPYRAHFRPRDFYAKLFGRTLELEYQAPTVAHFLPWFLGGTQEAAKTVGEGRSATLLRRVTPLLVPLDPYLQRLEDAFRARPLLRRLLADVPVVQDFSVFRARGDAAATREPALSVVVIAYNEAECITPVVRELQKALSEAHVDYELVLVDDGSKDTTLSQMHSLAEVDSRTQIVPLSPNRGIGGALRAGFDAARGRHVTGVPADGQIGPDVVTRLYAERGRAPMLTTVYETRDDAWYRHVISQTLNRAIQLRTGQVAKSGGNYLFERSLWQKHAPRDDDSMMISTAFRHNLREAGVAIEELGIAARARVAGSSKVLNPRTILRTLGATLGLRR